MATKNILVTGGNAGIGYALCRQLVTEHDCKVYMGSRSAERGQKSVDAIKEAHPEVSDRLELLVIDVSNNESVATAASEMKNKGVSLYALVNNAGVGFQTGGKLDDLLNTNFYGPQRVSKAFVGMIQDGGRIVNVSSGAASMYLRQQSVEKKKFYSSSETTWEELAAAVEEDKKTASMGGYGLSKAALTAYTIQQAVQYPNLICTSLSPGFIATNMTNGFGASLTAEEGTVSLKKCLIGDVVSGYYYGSDGLRSPLTVTRDPGTPEYQGEENPDASKYNK
eukprot:CAMPEP_0185723374 /NCGR_PEP_ID=MMETSP1171-20130828/237_1 /TAXON_ID=374046 /ORGANISM="Helicotheca tamensis, Strain CCMP826" /LENGTH=279 /DNA_ID=CAMNT_0028391067 /DNA_START=16 /DNA_END=855 /DNA_ORIENTATION=+